MSSAETGRVRERQRGDQVQLSTTVPPTVLRLHRQPGAVLGLPDFLFQRRIRTELHSGSDTKRHVYS